MNWHNTHVFVSFALFRMLLFSLLHDYVIMCDMYRLLHGKQFDMVFGTRVGESHEWGQIPYQTVYHVINNLSYGFFVWINLIAVIVSKQCWYINPFPKQCNMRIIKRFQTKKPYDNVIYQFILKIEIHSPILMIGPSENNVVAKSLIAWHFSMHDDRYNLQ